MKRREKSKLVLGLAVLMALTATGAVSLTPTPGKPMAPGSAKAKPDKTTGGPVTQESSFIVLCYHRFVERPETVKKPLNQYRFPMQDFRWQMQFLKDNGITPISMDQLKAYWFQGTPLPEKAVLLTFDDGFRSIYEKAYPAIKEFGYPGVLFLYSDFIRGQSDSMKYSEIGEMQKNGFDLESHTKRHLKLALECEKRTPSDFAQLLDEELKDPIQFIMEKFNFRSKVIAYSYGSYNQEILEQTRKAGYQLAFTVNPGPNDRTVPPLQLKRNLILYPTKHEAFKRIFADKVLHLKNLVPDDGEVVWDKQPVIKAVILDDMNPKTLFFHLGDHPLAFFYNKKTHLLRHRIGAPLKSGGHMLTLEGLDLKGQRRVYTWYIRVKHRNLKKDTEEETITHPFSPLAPKPNSVKEGSKINPAPGLQDAKETGI